MLYMEETSFFVLLRHDLLSLYRFSRYRDTFVMHTLCLVPILSLLGHIRHAHKLLCPDSLTIGTHSSCTQVALSRFSHYRDTFIMHTTSSVPILPLSRHIRHAHNFHCPDSVNVKLTMYNFDRLRVYKINHYLLFLSDL